MTSLSDRQAYLPLIRRAREEGARLHKIGETVGLHDRTLRRWMKDPDRGDRRPEAHRPQPAHALSQAEKDRIIEVCARPKFRSLPPECIVGMLADRGEYLGSERTFYRVLRERDQLHHRGKAREPRKTAKPVTHTSTAPNEVWVWDITWLPGPVKGVYFHLQLLLDLYSRKVVAHEVWRSENAENSATLLQRAMFRESVPPERELVLHGDNGSALKCGTVYALCRKLGVAPSHSRPRVSNDNAHAESFFRTAKYHPDLPPEGFETLMEAREWAEAFTNWYNQDHLHSGIGWVTPEQKHRGEDKAILENRSKVYEAARAENPKRWIQGKCRKWEPVNATTLNPIDERQLEKELKKSA